MCSSFFHSRTTYKLINFSYSDFIKGTHSVEASKSNIHKNLINLAVDNLWIPPEFVFVLLDGILPTKQPPEHMSCSIVWAHFKNLGSVNLWLVGSLSSAEYELAMCYKKKLYKI